MEVLHFLLEQTAFLLWVLEPILPVILLGVLAALSVWMLVTATAARNAAAMLGGLLGLVIAAGGSWGTYVYFKGKPGKMAQLTVAQPHAVWSGPAPSAFVSAGRWDAGPVMAMVRAGVVKRVLRQGRRTSYKPQMALDPENKTLWEELRVKESNECQAAWLRGLQGVESDECIEVLPVVLPTGAPEEPYWAEAVQRDEMAETSTISFSLVNGASRHLVLSCSAEWPRPRHFLAGLLTWSESSKVTKSMHECRQAALDGRLVAALAR